MIANSNVYGSYYSSLLTGMNLLSSSPRPGSSVKIKSVFDNFVSYEGVDYDAAQSIYAMKMGANKLHVVMSKLNSHSLFSEKAPVSSDASALEVSGSLYGGKEFENIDITISQIASGQQNEGYELNSGTRVVSGANEFVIVINGMAEHFAFDLKPGETNKTLQSKIASAINDRGIGIEARVSEIGEKSKLILEAQSTGLTDASSFTVSDTIGSAISRTGVGSITSPPQEAKYTINGEERTSNSNKINISSDIRAVLKEASNEHITITAMANGAIAATTIDQMARSINGILANAENAGAYSLYRDISNAGKTYSRSLASIGVSLDTKGYMSVDSEKLETAAKNGSLENAVQSFNDTSYGYTQRVSRITEKARSNPAGYSLTGTLNQFLGVGLIFNMIM